jgi:hypothetical protein
MSARSKLLVLLALAVACACTAAVAQQPATPPVPAGLPATMVPQAPQPGQAPIYFGGGKDQAQITKLAKQYVKAEKDDEKKEIRKKLSELLTKQFDLHVQQQQKELEDLEKQITTLRATLKKRSDAKASIVDRRVEQLILDAEGMGWNVPNTPRSGGGGALSPPLMAPKKESGPDNPFEQPRN